tara:strand:- start:23548 stop:24336 length:789 start_codon:yes stop_codon:yes gene_type:complete
MVTDVVPSWLSCPVVGYGEWPIHETEVTVDNHTFVFSPLTSDRQASLHIELVSSELEHKEAIKIINNILSLLCFCSNEAYWLGKSGGSGSTAKQLAFPREQLKPFIRGIDSFPNTLHLISDVKTLRSLAHFRDARVAQLFSPTTACLAFYKVLERFKREEKEEYKDWIDQQLDFLEDTYSYYINPLGKRAEMAKLSLQHFLFKAIRNSAVHALIDINFNRDDDDQLKMFDEALPVLEYLAQTYISDKLCVPDLLQAHQQRLF